jgi:hypothetical protein
METCSIPSPTFPVRFWANISKGYRKLFPVRKAAGHETHNSQQPSARIKNSWSYTFTDPYAIMAPCSIKHRDNYKYNFLPLHLNCWGVVTKKDEMNSELPCMLGGDNSTQNYDRKTASENLDGVIIIKLVLRDIWCGLESSFSQLALMIEFRTW